MKSEQWTKTTLRMPKSLLREVKQYALDHEVTNTDVIIEALKEYLSKHKAKEKAKTVEH